MQHVRRRQNSWRNAWLVALLGLFALTGRLAAEDAETGRQSLRQQSRAFAKLAKQVKPAVVFISVEKAVQARIAPGASALLLVRQQGQSRYVVLRTPG
jgi:S1-C subfamily serine protease